jgi:hypothetical protein
MPDDVNHQRAQRLLQTAATSVAALHAAHLTTEDILSADTGELDAFTSAVEGLADLVLPKRDYVTALTERGIDADTADELMDLFWDYTDATQRAAFALGVAFAAVGGWR